MGAAVLEGQYFRWTYGGTVNPQSGQRLRSTSARRWAPRPGMPSLMTDEDLWTREDNRWVLECTKRCGNSRPITLGWAREAARNALARGENVIYV
jgi:hypothetical protein